MIPFFWMTLDGIPVMHDQVLENQRNVHFHSDQLVQFRQPCDWHTVWTHWHFQRPLIGKQSSDCDQMITSPQVETHQLASECSSMTIMTVFSRRLTVRKGAFEIDSDDFACPSLARRMWISSSISQSMNAYLSNCAFLLAVTFEMNSKICIWTKWLDRNVSSCISRSVLQIVLLWLHFTYISYIWSGLEIAANLRLCTCREWFQNDSRCCISW
jgi:hypothetical protein